MSMYMIGDQHKEIAEVIGMEAHAITNIIYKLKKELNEFLNKGLENE